MPVESRYEFCIGPCGDNAPTLHRLLGYDPTQPPTPPIIATTDACLDDVKHYPLPLAACRRMEMIPTRGIPYQIRIDVPRTYAPPDYEPLPHSCMFMYTGHSRENNVWMYRSNYQKQTSRDVEFDWPNITIMVRRTWLLVYQVSEASFPCHGYEVDPHAYHPTIPFDAVVTTLGGSYVATIETRLTTPTWLVKRIILEHIGYSQAWDVELVGLYGPLKDDSPIGFELFNWRTIFMNEQHANFERNPFWVRLA